MTDRIIEEYFALIRLRDGKIAGDGAESLTGTKDELQGICDGTSEDEWTNYPRSVRELNGPMRVAKVRVVEVGDE